MARVELFTATICQRFGLGADLNGTVTPMHGRANRMWHLHVNHQRFAIKEFRYTVSDEKWLAAIRRAAEFEFTTWQTGRVAMPEPIRCQDGALIPVIVGSRGVLTAVRLHRWQSGTPIVRPVLPATATLAAEQLYQIHQIGRRFATAATGQLRWWRWDPLGVMLRLHHRRLITASAAHLGRVVIAEAERLIAQAERSSVEWIFSHYDYSPDNALTFGNGLAVLDWDEAALCQPHMETVEAALRWSGLAEGRVHGDTFIGILNAYFRRQPLGRDLMAWDFAKCVASYVGWFEYMGRRALREFDENDHEASAAVDEAISALRSLESVLSQICIWRKWAS